MYQKILVPLDGSTFAEQALPYAKSLAETYNAAIVLLAVYEPLIALIPAIRHQKELAALDAYLQSKEDALRRNRIRAEHMTMDGGNAANLILLTAETQSVDLIVMTSHGRSGFERWQLGSVAERVLRHAKMPVMLVRSAKVDEGRRSVKPFEAALVA